MNLRTQTSSHDRRKALEKALGIQLTATSRSSFGESEFLGHCENPIGATQVPVGVAGPLEIRNSKSETRNFYVPLATTEGALVASINRGCKAIRQSGGALAYAYRVGATRGPVFLTESIEGNRRFYEWIKGHEQELQDEAGKTSQHLHLKKITTKSVGQYSFVRLVFDTVDAMGMNMVTIATQAITIYIQKQTGFTCLAVAGNFDIDKKPAWLNFIDNRGYKVWSEVVLPKKVVTSLLKTTPQKFFQTWLAKCVYGSVMSGSLGFNAQFANVVAALYLATGQDPAHVVEGSMGITTTELLLDGDLYVSVYLPAVLVGTVGGGTSLPTQREALHLLGLAGGGMVEEFAEIVGAAVLAGEISLLASLAEGSLAKTHEYFRSSKLKTQSAKLKRKA